MTLEIPPEVADCLGYYVYLYVDPNDKKPFYVGKGQGRRVLAHLSNKIESLKKEKIKQLRDASLEPEIEILAHALPSEETAPRIEAAVIDLLGLDDLTNLVSGWKSIQFGRMPLKQLVAYYAANPVEVVDPCLLIRINRLYRHGMSEGDLYGATRGRWKLGTRRETAKFALAVFEGVVREVFEIQAWHPAGETTSGSTVHSTAAPKGRWEFTGKKAHKEVRNKYLDRSVASYFTKGQQSPVLYVNC
jgi:hypothetical protein